MAVAVTTYVRPRVGSNYYFNFDAQDKTTEVNYNDFPFSKSILQEIFNILSSYTSTTCFYNQIEESLSAISLDALLLSDKIDSIQFFYGLNKSDLCKICGVSRPTLYSWLKNKTVPEKKNIHKLNMLYDIYKDNYANKVKSLFHGYNKEIIAYLLGQSATEEGLKNKIADAVAKTQQRTARITERRNAEYNKNISVQQQEDVLETNLLISE